MEFKSYFVILKRWYWLLLLGLFLGAAFGIVISKVQQPVYQATAKVLVMRVPDTSTSGLAYLGDQELAATFSELITTQPVFDTVSNQLGFKVDPSNVKVLQNPNSQIRNVVVEDSDPQRCAKIANAVVDTAIKRYVDLQVGQYTAIQNDVQTQIKFILGRMTSVQSQITTTSETIINNQMDQIQSQLTPLQDEASSLQQDIAKLNPPTTPDEKSLLAQKQARLEQIQPLITQYQNAYSNLVVLNQPIGTGSADENNLVLLKNQLASYQQSYVDLNNKLELLNQNYVNGISNVTRIQDASIPVHPIRPQVLINTLLTTIAGLLLAIVAIFLLENLGITLRTPDRRQKQLDSMREERQKTTPIMRT
jgi:succinoglycan biosynthesis transport protein ExoP